MNGLVLVDVMAVALGLGLGTLAFRLVFGEMREKWTIPSGLQAALGWVPVAALAAMTATALVPANAVASEGSPRWLAAAVSVWIAHKTRNLLLTVGAGMMLFWILERLL